MKALVFKKAFAQMQYVPKALVLAHMSFKLSFCIIQIANNESFSQDTFVNDY